MSRAVSCGEPPANGPRPLTAPKIVTITITASALAVPVVPRRTAAHSRNGSGA